MPAWIFTITNLTQSTSSQSQNSADTKSSALERIIRGSYSQYCNNRKWKNDEIDGSCTDHSRQLYTIHMQSSAAKKALTSLARIIRVNDAQCAGETQWWQNWLCLHWSFQNALAGLSSHKIDCCSPVLVSIVWLSTQGRAALPCQIRWWNLSGKVMMSVSILINHGHHDHLQWFFRIE